MQDIFRTYQGLVRVMFRLKNIYIYRDFENLVQSPGIIRWNMRSYCLSFIEGFIHSKVYISLAAVLLTLQTQIMLGLQPTFYPYVFLIFFGTFFEYNFHRVFELLSVSGNRKMDSQDWVEKNKVVFYGLILLSAFGLLLTLGFAQRKILLSMAPVFMLTWCYSAPFEWPEFRFLKIRSIPFLKIFIISAVWSAITVFIPVIHASSTDLAEILLLFAERFLFIFSITIPFDIRDMQADAREGLKTIPLYLGVRQSVLLACFLLALSVVTGFLHFMLTDRLSIALAILLSGAMIFCCLRFDFVRKMPLYHYGILDGAMILQGLCVWLCSFWETFYRG